MLEGIYLYHVGSVQLSLDMQESKRLSHKNELEHMKGKYKNLKGHNTKLKRRLQQKVKEFERQTKIMSVLKVNNLI